MAHEDAPKRKRDGSWESVDKEKDERTITWGVASTGQVSDQGLVRQIERPDGSMDAIVTPQPSGVGVAPGGFGPRPDDFTLDDFQVDLSALEQQVVEAVRSGQLKTRPNPKGPGRIVDPRDFQKWVAGL